ncbi:MAG: plastocyanin/azurin family copper-binding protein [Gemmatimonadaceae bacterium]
MRLRRSFTLGTALLLYGVAPRAQAAQAAADTTITIKAVGSTLEFVPARISAKTGTRLRIRLVNEGTLPHNVVLPRSEDDIDGLVLAAYQAAESGFVPLGQKGKILAFTTLASPGQTVEVTLTVPPPGEYTYICLFPGHATSMFGTLRALR